MWQLSDSFSDEKNHKAVSHPAVLLMLIKLNYPLLARMERWRAVGVGRTDEHVVWNIV